MKSFLYALTLSFVVASTTMAATHEQSFKLKYLKEVTHGEVIHTVEVKAADFNEAITKSRKRCMMDLMDRRISSEDIVDMCTNPRL